MDMDIRTKATFLGAVFLIVSLSYDQMPQDPTDSGLHTEK